MLTTRIQSVGRVVTYTVTVANGQAKVSLAASGQGFIDANDPAGSLVPCLQVDLFVTAASAGSIHYGGADVVGGELLPGAAKEFGVDFLNTLYWSNDSGSDATVEVTIYMAA